jgi:lysophospholipid acyltransferase (LPLAT)-like uncharacterized protein
MVVVQEKDVEFSIIFVVINYFKYIKEKSWDQYPKIGMSLSNQIS